MDSHDLLQDDAFRQAHLELAQQVDLYMPSEQDVARLLPGLTPLSVLYALRERAPRTTLIVLKMGADGLLAHAEGGARYLQLPSLAHHVTDTTGAGDAFCGGALAALCKGGDP